MRGRGERIAKKKPKDEAQEDEPSPEYESFQQIRKQVLPVPKEEMDRRRAEYEREKKEKRAG